MVLCSMLARESTIGGSEEDTDTPGAVRDSEDVMEYAQSHRPL